MLSTEPHGTYLIVWGLPSTVPPGSDRFEEQLLAQQCRTSEDVEKVKASAGAAGWHSFRVSTFTAGDMPYFAGAVRR